MFKLTRSTPGCFLVASVTNADLMMTSIAKVSLHSSVGCWWGWGLPDEGRNWESEEKIWAWEPGAPGTARSSAAQLLSFIGWHGVTLTTGGGHHGQHWWSLVSVFSVLTCVVTLCRDVNSSRVTMLPSPRPTDDWAQVQAALQAHRGILWSAWPARGTGNTQGCPANSPHTQDMCALQTSQDIRINRATTSQYVRRIFLHHSLK